MIEVIPATRRYFSDFGWLKTHWLFSFSDYYDPANIQFGALRVFNDDIVAPGMGFPTHPHREMEIITVVLSGAITHKDSLGNTVTISAGEVQRMSAGTGMTHSEFNVGTEPVHFYQLWFYPDKPRLAPSYDQRTYAEGSWSNMFLPIASGRGLANVVTFQTDASVHRSAFSAGKSLSYVVDDRRKVFLYLTSGALRLNQIDLNTGDQARVDLEPTITVKAVEDSEFLLIDVPSCQGWGYDRQTLRGAKSS